jgi:hypothetical protein
VSRSNDRVTGAVIGVAFVLGSLVLLYLSSRAEMHCRRASGVAECTVRARALNAITVHEDTVRDVRGATLDAGNSTLSNEGGTRINFNVSGRPVDLGVFSQRFRAYVGDFDAFAKDPSQARIDFVDQRRVRDYLAPAIAIVMLFLGVSALAGTFRR